MSFQLKKILIQPKNYTKRIFKRYQGGFSDDSYVRTTLVQMKPEEGYSLQITGVNQYGFIINKNIRAIGPIFIFPKTILSWNVSDINDINVNSLSLFKILEPKLDIIIIGTGDKGSKINSSVPKWLIQNKIKNFEILPTEKAVSAFNFLIAEDRFVAGALLPSIVVREGDTIAKQLFDTSELYNDKLQNVEKSGNDMREKIK